MKTINVTDEEQAELLKLRAKKTAQATSAESSDVVRAEGNSEGAKKGWEHRAKTYDAAHNASDLATQHSLIANGAGSAMNADALHKEAAEAHEHAAKTRRDLAAETHGSDKHHHLNMADEHSQRANQHYRQMAKYRGSDNSANTEIIHCRSHSASGPVLAADKPWSPGEQVEFMWMPAGTSTICAGFRKGSIELTVNCDENTAAAVQASLESWRAERPKQEPFGCIEHKEQEASFRVGASCGFKWNEDGVYLAAEPTTLGAQNVNGRVHRSWSPSFTTDADYSKATERNGVLMFPEGARGSRSNPAQITGVDFCVGTLTNKPAFHSMSPVKASDAVQAGGTSEGVKKGWESRHSQGMQDASVQIKAWTATDSAHRHSMDAWRSGEKKDHRLAAEKHSEAAAAHEAAGNKDQARHHSGTAPTHRMQGYEAAKASDTTSTDSIKADCANTLKQDVPDATPAEVACYEKCLEDGGSHTRAVEEIRKQRNPAAKASLEEIYDKVTAAWSPQARAAAAAARKNHKGLSPEHKKIAEGVAESSDHANADDFYHSVNEAGVWKDSGIPSHLHSEALDHATAHFEKINATNTTTPDTILARQASVLEQANAIATEHGVARTTLDDVYEKVTAGTSEGVKKSWETRKYHSHPGLNSDIVKIIKDHASQMKEERQPGGDYHKVSFGDHVSDGSYSHSQSIADHLHDAAEKHGVDLDSDDHHYEIMGDIHGGLEKAVKDKNPIKASGLALIYSKCAVTATGTSEGAKKGWENRFHVVKKSNPANPSFSQYHVIEKGTGRMVHSAYDKEEANYRALELNEHHNKGALNATDAAPQDILNKIYARAETVSAEGNSEGAAKGWESRHHGRASILGIGSVNLKTHKNEMFGEVWHGWDKDKGSNLVVSYDGKQRAIHTSGSGGEYKSGDTIDLYHDQTMRKIADRAKIESVHPHSEDGMKQIAAKTGKGSLSFYTFK